MKTNTLLGLIVALFCISSQLMGQMKYWETPPYIINTSTTPPSAQNSLTSGAYSVANGTYDQNGALLFYIKDYNIYDASNNVVGILAGYNLANCSGAYTTLSPEIAIVPIPGTCKQYYIIYSMDNPNGNSPLLYETIDCSGKTLSVTYGNYANTYCPPYYTGIQPEAFYIRGHGGSDNTSFAVSQIVSGTGSSSVRYLLSVSQNSIVKSEITSNGISDGTTVVTAAALGLNSSAFVSFEAEIAWDNTWFAWSSENGTVQIVGINPTQFFYNGSRQSYNISRPKGIEFDSSPLYPKLYVSETYGITEIQTSNQNTNQFNPWPYDLSNTFLEYGKNGLIYGISPTFSGSTLTATTFVGIDPSNLSLFSFNPGLVDSRFDIGYMGQYDFFTLPDQIDGENYEDFNGIPAIEVTNMTINGNTPTGACLSGGVGIYCQNDPISFEAYYAISNPSAYMFTLNALDGNCAVLNGAGYIDYTGSWITGYPTQAIDLKSLTDNNGVNLGNCHGGLVQVTYWTKNQCDHISQASFWLDIYQPIPPSINLEIYDLNNPQTYLSPSQNIQSPINVGTASVGYRVNNSTGTITSMTVRIYEVNPSPYSETLIYENTNSVNGVSGLTYENLNGYCIDASLWSPYSGFNSCSTGATSGWTGYFSYTNGLFSYQNYYKLFIELGNMCGTSNNYSYLYFNSIGNKPLGVNQVSTNYSLDNVAVYPNPARDNITVRFEVIDQGKYGLQITDVLGRTQMVLLPKTQLAKGIFNQTFDISNLAKGVYMFQVLSPDSVNSRIITKQ